MHIIDRRLNPGSKSLENHQRFLRRAKALVQGAVKKSSQDRDIKDVLEGSEVRVPLPLQLRESEMFDLDSAPYKDSDELCMACVPSALTLSVQKGSLRYPALFDFAAVLHNEMDIIASNNP
jgi:hypothetical protein